MYIQYVFECNGQKYVKGMEEGPTFLLEFGRNKILLFVNGEECFFRAMGQPVLAGKDVYTANIMLHPEQRNKEDMCDLVERDDSWMKAEDSLS